MSGRWGIPRRWRIRGWWRSWSATGRGSARLRPGNRFAAVAHDDPGRTDYDVLRASAIQNYTPESRFPRSRAQCPANKLAPFAVPEKPMRAVGSDTTALGGGLLYRNFCGPRSRVINDAAMPPIVARDGTYRPHIANTFIDLNTVVEAIQDTIDKLSATEIVEPQPATPATNGFAPLKAGVRDEAIFAGPGIIKVRPGPTDFLANPATITWGTIYTTCLMSRDEMMMDINLNSVSK